MRQQTRTRKDAKENHKTVHRVTARLQKMIYTAKDSNGTGLKSYDRLGGHRVDLYPLVTCTVQTFIQEWTIYASPRPERLLHTLP